jgi:hypothetical protein
MHSTQENRVILRLLALVLLLLAPLTAVGDERDATANRVDCSTLRGKVMCGYQGWFRCPGDTTDRGWLHWSRDSRRIAPDTLTIDMWPDMSEYSDDERYPAPAFTLPDGSPATLFSSAHPRTVERHFEWMRDYGIDGAFVQRFLVNLRDPSFDRVLDHARKSAAKTGRAYAVCYDLSGTRESQLVERLTRDWQQLVDEQKLTKDANYLRHGGKPVVFVWGFYPDRFSGETAHRIIDIFGQDDSYSATLIGGCDWQWRKHRDEAWSTAFRRLDVLSPWNVGNVTIDNNQKDARTDYWKSDLAEVEKNGREYLPVVYPGFSWINLKGSGAAKDSIPRRGGEFYWRQFAAAGQLGNPMVYVAMFDEVDEATAIFKVTNSPPREAPFVTYDDLPSDWYLRLTREGAKVIRGEEKPSYELPIKP